ncbi:MAG: HEAT repeat protein [halophilic archaeon J07HB67]|jgi:FOG: HEAT repeat|nr:MAG: HEAT repeat protein [halophilic archaeon J07HB67]
MSLYQLARDNEIEELSHRAQSSDSDAVRRRAAEMLGDVGEVDDTQVIDTLSGLALEDDHPEVRAMAVDALSDLGQEALEQLILKDKEVDTGATDWTAVQAFGDALASDRAEYRMAAASALGRIGDEDGLRPLVERLSDDDPRVRERVCYALGQIRDPNAVDPLIERLEDDHERVRSAAADALGTIATPPALAALLAMLDDDNAAIRRVAASALGNAGSAEPVPELVEGLGDPHGAVRQAAVFSVIQLLSTAPTDQSHQVREAIVEELEEVDDETVVAPLLEVMEEASEASQRRNAVWFLGRVTDREEPPQEVVDALVETLSDSDRMTAQFASTSVTELGGLYVESSLIDLLQDNDHPSAARARAAYALGEVGGERAREVLDRMTDEDVEPDVRKRAFSALSKLGGIR